MDDWRRDPIEENGHEAAEMEMYGDIGGSPRVICEDCGAVLHEGDPYYEICGCCYCEPCFDDWANDKRRVV